VVLVDLDLGERSLDVYLGCEDHVVYDMGDLLNGTRDVGGVAVTVPQIDGLHFVAGAYHLRRMPTGEELERMFSQIENALLPDFLVVDTSSVSDPSTKLCAKLCDLAILVATPGVLSLRSTASLSHTLQEFGVGEMRLVVNGFSCDPKHPSKPDIREMVDTSGVRLLGILPRCDGIPPTQDEGTFLSYINEQNLANIAFDNMARRLLGKTCPLMSNMSIPRKKLLDI
jgi:septum site-determining protein MinD